MPRFEHVTISHVVEMDVSEIDRIRLESTTLLQAGLECHRLAESTADREERELHFGKASDAAARMAENARLIHRIRNRTLIHHLLANDTELAQEFVAKETSRVLRKAEVADLAAMCEAQTAGVAAV